MHDSPQVPIQGFQGCHTGSLQSAMVGIFHQGKQPYYKSGWVFLCTAG